MLVFSNEYDFGLAYVLDMLSGFVSFLLYLCQMRVAHGIGNGVFLFLGTLFV